MATIEAIRKLKYVADGVEYDSPQAAQEAEIAKLFATEPGKVWKPEEVACQIVTYRSKIMDILKFEKRVRASKSAETTKGRRRGRKPAGSDSGAGTSKDIPQATNAPAAASGEGR